MADQLFIVGAQRSGTTYLYNILDEHPELFMRKPVWPEPKTFLADSDALGSKVEYLDKHFPDRGEYAIVGEKCTSYIESELAAANIQTWFPDAWILILLRNPVQRAISNFYFTKKNGLEPRSIEQVFLENEPAPERPAGISVNPFAYLDRGIYSNYIERWAGRFDPTRTLVLLHEELIENPSSVSELYGKLGLASDFSPPSLKKRINEAGNGQGVDARIIEALKEYYQPHNQRFADTLGRDLGIWS